MNGVIDHQILKIFCMFNARNKLKVYKGEPIKTQ